MIIFSSFEVGMNFLIKACFFLHFKKLLRKFEFLFYFFSYFKLIFFLMFLYYFDVMTDLRSHTQQNLNFLLGQDPMFMGPANADGLTPSKTQRWRVLVAARPKTDGSASSSTQLKWVMFSAGPKAIWIPLGVGPNAIESCWNKTR